MPYSCATSLMQFIIGDAVYYWRIVPEVRIPFIAFVLSYALWIANVYFSYTFIVEGFYDFPS